MIRRMILAVGAAVVLLTSGAAAQPEVPHPDMSRVDVDTLTDKQWCILLSLYWAQQGIDICRTAYTVDFAPVGKELTAGRNVVRFEILALKPHIDVVLHIDSVVNLTWTEPRQIPLSLSYRDTAHLELSVQIPDTTISGFYMHFEWEGNSYRRACFFTPRGESIAFGEVNLTGSFADPFRVEVDTPRIIRRSDFQAYYENETLGDMRDQHGNVIDPDTINWDSIQAASDSLDSILSRPGPGYVVESPHTKTVRWTREERFHHERESMEQTPWIKSYRQMVMIGDTMYYRDSGDYQFKWQLPKTTAERMSEVHQRADSLSALYADSLYRLQVRVESDVMRDTVLKYADSLRTTDTASVLEFWIKRRHINILEASGIRYEVLVSPGR